MKAGLQRFSVFAVIFLFITALMLCAALWYVDIYGLIGCDAILFTLTTSIDGVQSGLITSFLLRALLPALLISGGLFILLRMPRIKRWLRNALCIVICLVMAVTAMFAVELPQFVLGLFQQTELYQQEYVDPKAVEITFPEQKRNLIFIYLESMENTFFGRDQGGVKEENRLPELYALAENNLNFSENESVGGGLALRGSTWTMGAMIAHTAGLPMRVTPGSSDDSHMNNAVALGDILRDNGYYQALMVGSDAHYGRRAEYYQAHGCDEICDLYAAREAGFIPDDYRVWWGMEDLKLYEYAKQKLSELAAQDQPFAFTLLTADTHHVAGYVCEACENAYDEQYDNVYACASRQAAEFVAWLQAQDFFENTTIILCGDHPSMDGAYFRRHTEDGYTRCVYNCFINAAAEPEKGKNRAFSTMDMFPTTLAALGCAIEGERLGLGVNLFSGEETLLERYGEAYLDAEILKYADEYAAFLK